MGAGDIVESVGGVAIDVAREFAKAKIADDLADEFIDILARLVTLGLAAAIDEAYTKRMTATTIEFSSHD